MHHLELHCNAGVMLLQYAKVYQLLLDSVVKRSMPVGNPCKHKSMTAPHLAQTIVLLIQHNIFHGPNKKRYQAQDKAKTPEKLCTIMHLLDLPLQPGASVLDANQRSAAAISAGMYVSASRHGSLVMRMNMMIMKVSAVTLTPTTRTSSRSVLEVVVVVVIAIAFTRVLDQWQSS